MLLIPCPHCGPRAEIEFRWCGEAHLLRPSPEIDDAAWTAYLYERPNPRGPTTERWRHVHGCGQFFNVVRDTLSDVIVRSYAAGEPA